MKLLCCWRGGEGEEGSPRATEALREELRPPTSLAAPQLAPQPSPRLPALEGCPPLPPRWSRGEVGLPTTASMLCLRAGQPVHQVEEEATPASPLPATFGPSGFGGLRRPSQDSQDLLTSHLPATATREHPPTTFIPTCHLSAPHPFTSALSTSPYPNSPLSAPHLSPHLPSEHRPSLSSARSPICRLVFPNEMPWAVEGEGEVQEEEQVVEGEVQVAAKEEVQATGEVLVFDDEQGKAKIIAT